MLAALRLAGGPRDRALDVGSISCSSDASWRALAQRPPVADVDEPPEEGAAPARCCRCRRGSSPSTSRSWPGRWSTHTIRRSSSAGSCSSSVRARDGAVSEPRRAQDAAAGRLLPGRSRHPRRPAGMVDCAGARAALPRRRCSSARRILTAFNDNALITYLATLVPEPRATSLKIAVVAGRGDGRRPDRDRQRAQPGRPGAARPLLRRRHLAAALVAGALVPTRSRPWRSGCSERRARVDRYRQRGHRDRAARPHLSRRRRRAGAALGRLAAVRERAASTASAHSRSSRVWRDPPGPPRRPPALDAHGAGRVQCLPRVVRDLPCAARRLAVPRPGRASVRSTSASSSRTSCCPSSPADGAVDVLDLSLSGRFAAHRRVARWTFPIWLYVSITGVVVFVMLQIFGSART